MTLQLQTLQRLLLQSQDESEFLNLSSQAPPEPSTHLAVLTGFCSYLVPTPSSPCPHGPLLYPTLCFHPISVHPSRLGSMVILSGKLPDPSPRLRWQSLEAGPYFLVMSPPHIEYFIHAPISPAPSPKHRTWHIKHSP